MNAGAILCQEAKRGKSFFGVQVFERINRQHAHVWTGIAKSLDEWWNGRTIANLTKRPGHDPADLLIFQQRYEDRNGANVLQIAEEMRGVVAVRCDLSFPRPVAPRHTLTFWSR